MLTVWGKREGFCDGVTRRGFLQVGAFGAGLTLAEMLRLRAYEKLQNLVSRGMVEKNGKQYRGLDKIKEALNPPVMQMAMAK